MERYKNLFKEEKDLNEIIGYLKGKYKTISQVKSCPKFKKLSDADKEYVLDELKADKMKEAEEKSKGSDDEKAKSAIKELINTDWGGSNEEQGKAAELIRGLSYNNSDVANKFMDDLNKLTDKMDKSKYGSK